MCDGRDLRRMQDLVGVGVADAGERFLLLQHGLDLLAPSDDGAVEVRPRERRVGGVGPELGDGRHFARIVDDPEAE